MMVDGSQVELFNMEADSGERRNLAEVEPKVAEKLRRKLEAWNRAMSKDARKSEVTDAR